MKKLTQLNIIVKTSGKLHLLLEINQNLSVQCIFTLTEITRVLTTKHQYIVRFVTR